MVLTRHSHSGWMEVLLLGDETCIRSQWTVRATAACLAYRKAGSGKQL